MLEKKGIEKDRFSRPKGSTGRGYGQPAQPIREPIDWSTGCPCPVEDQSRGAQNFLSPNSLLFPVEVTVTCQALNASTASEPVNP